MILIIGRPFEKAGNEFGSFIGILIFPYQLLQTIFNVLSHCFFVIRHYLLNFWNALGRNQTDWVSWFHLEIEMEQWTIKSTPFDWILQILAIDAQSENQRGRNSCTLLEISCVLNCILNNTSLTFIKKYEQHCLHILQWLRIYFKEIFH